MGRYKEVFLEAASVMWGYVSFLYLFLPEEWKIGVSYIPPEIDVKQKIEEVTWVLSGRTTVEILPNLDKPGERIALRVKTNYCRVKPSFQRWLKKKSQEIEKSKSKKMDELGYVNVGNHEGVYAVWTEERKRLIFFGETIQEAKLLCLFYCDSTSRKIELEFSAPHPPTLLLNKVDLLTALSSIGCHGHAKFNKPKVVEYLEK